MRALLVAATTLSESHKQTRVRPVQEDYARNIRSQFGFEDRFLDTKPSPERALTCLPEKGTGMGQKDRF